VVIVSPLGTMQSAGEESSPLMQSIKDHLTSAQLDHVTWALQAEEVRDCSSQGTGGTVWGQSQMEEPLEACCDDDEVREHIR